MVDHAFASSHRSVVELMCTVLGRMYAAFPLPVPEGQARSQAATAVQSRVHELLHKYLTHAGDPATQLVPVLLTGLANAIAVLDAIAVGAPEYARIHVGALVRVLNRFAREHAAPGSLILTMAQPAPGAPPRANLAEPEWGSVVWVMWRGLRLAAPRALQSADHKKLFLQTLILLVTGDNPVCNFRRRVGSVKIVSYSVTLTNHL